MQVNSHPSAADSYARTLMRRGCPPLMAAMAAQVLARLDGAEPNPGEQALIQQAYAQLNH